jgi:hypothetical protein
MIVKELVARLGLISDKKSFDRANQQINKTKDLLTTIGKYISVGLVLLGAKKVINLASDANETLNVLNENFKENSLAVQKWAFTFGQSAQRSQYLMREMAGEMGSVLNPLMKGNASLAAEMSTNLTALAVDLGSFFNTTDNEALNALRSGMIGISIPLLKYGVVMRATNLEEYARAQGIRKTYKEMNEFEKTQLRYNFILAKTTTAQGDAIRTSGGFANASKGLLGGIRDLATTIGLKIIPYVEKFIRVSRFAINVINKWIQTSKIIEVALGILAVAAVAAGIKITLAWASALAPILLVTVAISALALVIEDFVVFLDGGDSAIGRFIDLLYGPGSATEAANKFNEELQNVRDYLSFTVFPAFDKFIDFFKADIGLAISYAKHDFLSFVGTIESGFKKIASFIKEYFGLDILSFFGTSEENLDKRKKERLAKQKRIKDNTENIKYEYDESEKERESLLERYNKKREKEYKAKIAKEEQIKKDMERRSKGKYTIDEILAMKQEEKIKIEKYKESQKQARIEKAEKIRLNKQKEILEKRQNLEEQRKYREASIYAKQKGYKKPIKNPMSSININQKTEVNVKGNIESRKNIENIAERISQKIGNQNKKMLNALVNVSE